MTVTLFGLFSVQPFETIERDATLRPSTRVRRVIRVRAGTYGRQFSTLELLLSLIWSFFCLIVQVPSYSKIKFQH